MKLGLLTYILIVGAVMIAIYYIATWNFNYWKKRNVPGPRPIPIFGNIALLITKKLALTEIFAKFYMEWNNHPVIGFYSGSKPILMVRDLDLIKSILTTDFHVFPASGLIFNESVDPLLAQIFILGGPRWRYLRSKLSPVFTTNKLKHMFDLILQCANNLEIYLHSQIEEGGIVECRGLATKFTINVIGSCAFGIDVKAFDNPDNAFMKYGKKTFDFDWMFILKRFIGEAVPRLYELLQIQVYPTEMSNFFITSIRDTMEHRKRKNLVRNDLIDVLLEMKENCDVKEIEMNDRFLAAQAFLFLAAGFETTSSTISFALFELAHHPEIQEKLRTEIFNYFDKYNGKITYGTIKEMNYFDMVFMETLRKNPPPPMIQRTAIKPYNIPGTDIVIEKDQQVVISVYGIHHNPEYYPNPDVFDPERFTEEAKKSRHPQAYLPFSVGPKNCIGSRFAEFEVKLALIPILTSYRLIPTINSPRHYEIDKGNFMLTCKNGIQLKFQPLKKI